MPLTEAKAKANQKYDTKAYWKFTMRIRKEYEEEIRKYAGTSLNGFVTEAIMEKIEREKNK